MPIYLRNYDIHRDLGMDTLSQCRSEREKSDEVYLIILV